RNVNVFHRFGRRPQKKAQHMNEKRSINSLLFLSKNPSFLLFISPVRVTTPYENVWRTTCYQAFLPFASRRAAKIDMLIDRQAARKSLMISAVRRPAFPSQRSIADPRAWPILAGIVAISSGRAPRRVFVPSVIVIGRSVESRSVKHGTPSAEVSSCTPPESVNT